jgi:galactose-1-phosphate uridylyltransferase
MPTITFEEEELKASVPNLATASAGPNTGDREWTTTTLRWRRDPLTGHIARVLTGVKLQPPNRPDLRELTAKPPFCPFCADVLEQATFPFPASLTTEGRIRRGQAVVVPNVLAYAVHSAVGLYDTERHFVDLDQLTPGLVGDGLAALIAHSHAVRRFDPSATWSSINANHLPPSGSSLVHPHMQSAHDGYGCTTQRFLVERSANWSGNYWETLLEQEKAGPRWVGTTGRVAWLTPFAPTGFYEVWGVVEGAADIVDLTDDDAAALGEGLSRIFGTYFDWNLTSFNFSLGGGGPDASRSRYFLLMKVVSRANAEPMYRSDVTYFEKLQDTALIDVAPEEVAESLRDRFK